MRKIKIGDIVSEKGRIGEVVNIATQGTADVQFEDMDFPIRRQGHNLQVVQMNPRRKLLKVPTRIKETDRSEADHIYAIPERKSFPIGDLFHARLALVYVLSPSHYVDRARVIQAVQDAYPEYNWASWWDTKSKGKDLLPWDQYLRDYRMVDGEAYPLAANPFLPRNHNSHTPNPKKVRTTEYDPSEAQFQAVVQGIYESLVKKYIGLKSSAPFKDDQGVRLDIKFFVPVDEAKKLLSSAFAIATKQGQKQGTLHKGTQKATKKGKAKSKERLKDAAHLQENIQDYETTLAFVREADFRIVKRKGRYYVQPANDFFNPKGYKTEASAKGAITRYENQMDEFEVLSNPVKRGLPQALVDKTKIGQKRARKQLDRMSKSYYKKTPRSTGWAQFEAKRSYAQGTGLIKRWRDAGFTDQEIKNKIDKLSVKPSTKGADEGLRSVPIVARLRTHYRYLPEMTENGEPYLIYRQAPIAAYYTIELTGPSYKFKYNQQVLLNKKRWKQSEWGEWGSFDIRDDTTYNQYTDEGQIRGQGRGRSIGIATVSYYPPMAMRETDGFNSAAIAEAKNTVIDAYEDWYDYHEGVMEDSDPELNITLDQLVPQYPSTKCRKKKANNQLVVSVIDPFQHFGVFMRALVELMEFKDALEIRGNGRWLDISPLVTSLRKLGILEAVEKSLRSNYIRLNQTFDARDELSAEQKLYQGFTSKEMDVVRQLEDSIGSSLDSIRSYIKEANLKGKGASQKRKDALDIVKRQESALTIRIISDYKGTTDKEPKSREELENTIGNTVNRIARDVQTILGVTEEPPKLTKKALKQKMSGIRTRQPVEFRGTRDKKRQERWEKIKARRADDLYE